MDTSQPPVKVVLNDEDQYAIWPVERENPAGWRDEGKHGPREECLSYIDEVWVDMRPRSVRERLSAGTD